MLDLGWQEFLLIAIMTVIVVGPKDLPRVIRTISQWIRKARSLASEFQGSLEEVAREAELDDVRKQVQSVSKDGLAKTIEQQIDPEGEIRSSVEDAKTASGVDDIDAQVREVEAEVKAAPAKLNGSRPADPSIETAEDYAASVTAPASKPAQKAAPKKRAASKPSAAKTSTTKTAATKATAAKPAAKATAAKPAASKPAASKPAAAKSPVAKSATAKSTAKPAAAKPKPARKPAARAASTGKSGAAKG